MSALRRTPATILALVVATVVTAVGHGVEDAAGAPAAGALGPGEVTVILDIEHSRFVPDELTVRAGTLVRFEVVNADPIHHELIVGPPAVHDAHAVGTERFHPPVPGEVSVGPNGTAMTFYAFDEPGTVAFACHLPGHLEYGMHGEVTVIPAAG